MIAAEAARRQDADSAHLAQLGDEMTDGLGAWYNRRRQVSRVAAMAVLLAVPALYITALPHHGNGTQVTCNVQGGEQLVMDCANTLLGK